MKVYMQYAKSWGYDKDTCICVGSSTLYYMYAAIHTLSVLSRIPDK